MAFGIDHLRREIEHRFNDVDAQLASIAQALLRLEGVVDTMPTRADLDAAKAELGKQITDATVRVNTDIQGLRDQIAAGNPVTDADLADLQNDIANVAHIDPAPTPVPPPPTP